MRIGELASQTGVDARLLRYYEQQGLLHPTRTPNGYRDYQDADVATVAWIRRLLAAGLSTATIAQFSHCAHDGRAATLTRLRGERARIGAVIAELEAAEAALDKAIDEIIAAGDPADGSLENHPRSVGVKQQRSGRDATMRSLRCRAHGS